MVPDIEQRLDKLKSHKQAGSPAIEMLEERYGITVEELIQRSALWNDDRLVRRRNCWQEEG